jgi:ESCRT-I complex subunit TSG101
MVSDPRVNPLLNRLGGVYRDPHRVDRDASSVLKSSVGLHLLPCVASLVENSGDVSNTLCLKGTISIHFRGQEYQQLVDLYLPPGYPVRPPVCFVRLASPQMYFKENHPHVGSDGQVYLPYLHEWRPHSHSLIELIVAMSSVFSADPPVFTRAVEPPPFSEALNHSFTTTTADYVINATTDSERDAIYQVQERIAIEQSAAEAEQKRIEEEALRQREAQEAWDAQNFASTKDRVGRKFHEYLVQQSRTTQTLMQQDMMDQRKLQLSRERLQGEMDWLQEQKQLLQEQHANVDTALVDVQAYLQEARLQQQQQQAQQPSVDDWVRPSSRVDAQLLDKSTQIAAYTDVLYFLDQALHRGTLDVTTCLREVRKLAKEQFWARAWVLKITQQRQWSGS